MLLGCAVVETKASGEASLCSGVFNVLVAVCNK